MATGEVLLNGTQLGIEGVTGFTLSNLLDANPLTSWSTFPDTSQPWAGIDAGIECTATRVLLSSFGGSEDYPIGAVVQVSASSQFLGAQGTSANHLSQTSTALSCSFSAPNSSGSAILVGIVCKSSSSVSSVVDTNHNTYTLAASQTDVGDALLQAIYIATNVVPNSPNTVTINVSPGSTYIVLTIWEQPGVVFTNPVDTFGTGVNSGGSTSISTNTFTTTQSDVIVAMCLSAQTDGITPGNGFTTQVSDIAGSNYVIIETSAIGSPGSYAATCTTSTSSAWIILAVALKPSGTGFGMPVNTLVTITNRTLAGPLINQYTLTPSQTWRYYRYLSSSNSYGSISDLDVYVQYTAGVIGAAVTPIITPYGGNYDLPTVVSLSSTTTDAYIFYTIDGSTPDVTSHLYSGPFPVTSTTVLKAIAISTNVSNSRIASAKFYIAPSSIISTDIMPLDSNRGIRVWAINPWIFQDPVTKYWYMYGANVDQVGVVTKGEIGNSIYRSADLRNWEYRAITDTPAAGQAKNHTTYTARPVMLYNVLNSNYVYWIHDGGHIYSYTATSAEGPFSLVGTYTTILSSGGVNSDFFVFLDSDNATAYIGFGDTGLNNFYFAQLNTAFTDVLGTGGTFNQYGSVATFGQKLDGMHMFKNGSTYFFMSSLPTNWTPNTNKYWTSSSPIGPWTLVGNPFQPVPNGIAGTYTDYTVAFNTQNDQVLSIPGRNAYVYLGDAFNTGLNASTSSSTTANFENYTLVILPVTFPTSGTMSISWNGNWNLDSIFPTQSGAPAAATSVSLSGSVLSWVNNETLPAYIYLDMYINTSIVASETVPVNATSFTLRLPAYQYFRIRTVNASGSSVSAFYPTNPPPPPPPPPPILSAGSAYVNNSYYDILLRSILRVKNTEALTYPEQTLTEPHSLTHGISPANEIPPEFQNEYVKLYALADYKYRV